MKDFERDNELLLTRKALESCASSLGIITSWVSFFGLLLVLKVVAALIEAIWGK